MSDQAKQKESAAIIEESHKLIGQMTTIQQNAHLLLVRTACYIYKYRDATLAEKVLNNIHNVKGSFRVEGLAYWLKHVAGISITHDAKTDRWGSAKLAKDEYKSDLGIAFSYDKEHVAELKKDNHKFWRVVPKTQMNLKLPDDVAKATASAETQLGRALAAGTMDAEQIQRHISTMMDNIIKASKSAKTQAWLTEFYLQNPELAPNGTAKEEAPSDPVDLGEQAIEQPVDINIEAAMEQHEEVE